mmetsp:Transcript_15026/g.29623  ORF Transcript_15026/g.29623 Transcript_15026/m.29623 type:complete len:230 (-) Transcript_15026:470-1159(-)
MGTTGTLRALGASGPTACTRATATAGGGRRTTFCSCRTSRRARWRTTSGPAAVRGDTCRGRRASRTSPPYVRRSTLGWATRRPCATGAGRGSCARCASRSRGTARLRGGRCQCQRLMAWLPWTTTTSSPSWAMSGTRSAPCCRATTATRSPGQTMAASGPTRSTTQRPAGRTWWTSCRCRTSTAARSHTLGSRVRRAAARSTCTPRRSCRRRSASPAAAGGTGRRPAAA